MKNLAFLISTYGDRLLSVPTMLFDECSSIKYVVVAQSASSKIKSEYDDLVANRADIRTIYSNETGVTRSRNVALSNIPHNTHYVYFLDDDVTLESDCYQTITKSFEESDFDCITFAAVTSTDRSRLLKKYWGRAIVHNKFTILRVGTIEIAVKASVFSASPHLKFPESMGAGSAYPLCDEPVFLDRLMKDRFKVGFMPKVTVRHPFVSSGKSINRCNEMMSRGIAFREIFGPLHYFINLIFFVKSFRKIGYSKISALADLYRGSMNPSGHKF